MFNIKLIFILIILLYIAISYNSNFKELHTHNYQKTKCKLKKQKIYKKITSAKLIIKQNNNKWTPFQNNITIEPTKKFSISCTSSSDLHIGIYIGTNNGKSINKKPLIWYYDLQKKTINSNIINMPMLQNRSNLNQLFMSKASNKGIITYTIASFSKLVFYQLLLNTQWNPNNHSLYFIITENDDKYGNQPCIDHIHIKINFKLDKPPKVTATKNREYWKSRIKSKISGMYGAWGYDDILHINYWGFSDLAKTLSRKSDKKWMSICPDRRTYINYIMLLLINKILYKKAKKVSEFCCIEDSDLKIDEKLLYKYYNSSTNTNNKQNIIYNDNNKCKIYKSNIKKET